MSGTQLCDRGGKSSSTLDLNYKEGSPGAAVIILQSRGETALSDGGANMEESKTEREGGRDTETDKERSRGRELLTDVRAHIGRDGQTDRHGDTPGPGNTRSLIKHCRKLENF